MTCSSNLATHQYSVQPRDQVFVKGYGFLSFAKNLSGKYTQDLT